MFEFELLLEFELESVLEFVFDVFLSSTFTLQVAEYLPSSVVTENVAKSFPVSFKAY